PVWQLVAQDAHQLAKRRDVVFRCREGEILETLRFEGGSKQILRFLGLTVVLEQSRQGAERDGIVRPCLEFCSPKRTTIQEVDPASHVDPDEDQDETTCEEPAYASGKQTLN